MARDFLSLYCTVLTPPHDANSAFLFLTPLWWWSCCSAAMGGRWVWVAPTQYAPSVERGTKRVRTTHVPLTLAVGWGARQGALVGRKIPGVGRMGSRAALEFLHFAISPAGFWVWEPDPRYIVTPPIPSRAPCWGSCVCRFLCFSLMIPNPSLIQIHTHHD